MERATQNIIGKNVQKIREKMGLTQDQLAARCEIAGFSMSRATLSKIEAQIRCVTDKELLKLSKILKCKADDLLSQK